MRQIVNTTFIILSILSFNACSSDVDYESAANEVCECLNSVEQPNEEDFQKCYNITFDRETSWVFDTEKLTKINVKLIKALGRTCKTASTADTGRSPNTDIKPIEQDREPSLTVKECRDFTKQEGLFYVETYGDTTQLSLKNDTYLETFPDGSFSKLDFKWTEGCFFDIEFVESNHYIKKNLSESGEIYTYQVIDHDKVDQLYTLHGYNGELLFQFTVHY